MINLFRMRSKSATEGQWKSLASPYLMEWENQEEIPNYYQVAEIQDARQDLQFPWRAKGSICKVSQWYKD